MCGIAGVFDLLGTSRPRPERVAELERMIGLIGHRGPDEAGWFVDAHAALSAVRLGITDLANGQQPMGDESERFFIVFNGEIYNFVELRAELEQKGHRFRTRCDTEVALRAWMEWGAEAPQHFEGGFAFAVYDRKARTAFLVRDRYGKRPLFWAHDGDSVVFASELKALLAREDMQLAWDERALASIFTKWTPAGAETPFRGVHQLPPGSILALSPDEYNFSEYEAFPIAIEQSSDSFERAMEETRTRLSRAVELRLRADVEVGVLLSGGLDSTIITSLVHQQRAGAKLRSFSISFADALFDESKDQALVVERLGLEHETLRIENKEIEGAFLDALWHAEIPQFRTAFVPMFLLARGIRNHGIKVVLSGEGADEVFLGYDLFKEARLRAEWGKLEGNERRRRVLALYPYLPLFNDANAKALEAVFARSLGDPDDPLFSHGLRLENGRFAARLIQGVSDEPLPLAEAARAWPEFSRLSAARKAQWLEVATLLQGYLLSSQGDRMMFAHGVEPRCPFLGREVVRYAAGLPERYLLSPEGDEKHLLKRAFADLVPDRILKKPKQPYRAPDAGSFLHGEEPGRFVPWAEVLLEPTELANVKGLDVDQATRLVTKLRTTPKERISPREDQAFLLLLSWSALDRQLVRREGLERPRALPPLTRTVTLGE